MPLDWGGFPDKLDKAIINISNGKLDSIAIIYEELRKPVFLLALTIVKDYNLAEDIMQETFLKVQTKADTYSKGTNPKAWILSITRNIAINVINKNKKEVITEQIEIAQNIQEEDLTNLAIDLERALSNIDLESKQIITLHIYANLKFTEIAEILDSNPSSIRVKYFRALKKLRKYFKDEKVN